jgi:hypothetical protein
VVPNSGDVEPDCVQRAGGGDEQVVALGAAEGEVGGDLGEVDLAEEGAVGVEAAQPVVGGGPDAAQLVQPQAVKRSGIAGGEDLAAGEGGAVDDVEAADVTLVRVSDVPLGFVG